MLSSLEYAQPNLAEWAVPIYKKGDPNIDPTIIMSILMKNVHLTFLETLNAIDPYIPLYYNPDIPL